MIPFEAFATLANQPGNLQLGAELVARSQAALDACLGMGVLPGHHITDAARRIAVSLREVEIGRFYP